MLKCKILHISSINKRIYYSQFRYNIQSSNDAEIFIHFDMIIHHFIIHTMFMYLVNTVGTKDTVLRPLANVSK